MRPGVLPILLAAGVLAACATSSREGRIQFVAPVEVSRVYSELDMQARLVTTSDAGPHEFGAGCPRTACDSPRDFEAKVLRIGQRLARSAYGLFPELRERIPRFEFGVAWKDEAGTLSNAGGAIVLLDGVRRMGLNDDALGFVIAREMGHVVGRHHEEDSATGLAASAVAGLLVPIANLFRGIVALMPGTAAVSAAASAASFAGSTVVRSSYRGDQVREADAIALQLVVDAGSEVHEIAAALASDRVRWSGDNWSSDLRASFHRIEALAWGPPRQFQAQSAEGRVAASAAPSN